MIYKCKNCGGNVVYDPTKKQMKCPHCESIDSQQMISQELSHKCVSCGADIETSDFTSATKCSHCGTYVIIEEQIIDVCKPNLVLPFMIDKNSVCDILKKRFKGKLFAPSDFLSQKTLESVEGAYVPFWLYDFHTRTFYEAIGNKIRVWTSGDKEYTETSKYAITRDIEIDYDRIPVDASNVMDDSSMRQVEPFEYNELLDFDPKFLSGFNAEVYNQSSAELEHNARSRVMMYTDEWIRTTISAYDNVEAERRNIDIQNVKTEFALLPIWIYTYRFRGKNYKYYVNGQTGEAVGKVPVSIQRAIILGLITVVVLFFFLMSLLNFLEVL